MDDMDTVMKEVISKYGVEAVREAIDSDYMKQELSKVAAMLDAREFEEN